MMTLRKYLNQRKSIRQNKRSHIKLGEHKDASSCTQYGQDLAIAKKEKEEAKAQKKLEKQNKKESK